MRRLLAVLSAFALLGLMAPAEARPRSAGGGAQSSMQYVQYERIIQNPIEQATDLPWGEDSSRWILNPFVPDCTWDADDHTVAIAEGALRAGESLSRTECVIASQQPYWMTVNGQTGWWSTGLGWYGVQVRADVATLDVRVCYEPEGRCFVAVPVYDAAVGKWVYNSCTQAAFAPGDPALAEIPGSQGGVGLVQAVTTTVTNPTGRNARNVDSTVGQVGVAYIWRGYGGCLKDALVVQDYPFQYQE